MLWEKFGSAMRLAAVDDTAARLGLAPHQSVSDARALVPNLEVRELNTPFLEHVFSDFADWHSNASPIVSVLTDVAPYGDLCLDITGVTNLFGTEERMLETLTSRLATLGYTVSGAIADTVGASWALAHFAPGSVVEDGGTEIALAPLPVTALRIEEVQSDGLNQMGLKTVGHLYNRDRRALQARFGASLLTRLDQALGHLVERLTPRIPVAEFYAEQRFADPIGLMDDVLMCVRDLAIKLSFRLEAEAAGAQSFHLFLYRVDHKVMTMSVNAARAIRDPVHIAHLFAYRSERLEGEYDPGFGIDMIRLAATSISDVASTQIGAFETRDGAEDLDRLFDRMTSRLGPLAVVRSKFVNTHIPEQAVKLEPVVARTPDDPEAKPDPTLPRPLRMLPTPEPIDVIAEVPDGPPARMIWRRVGYRFQKASGPERIEAEWWRSGHKLDLLNPSRTRAPKTDEKGNPLPKPYVPDLPSLQPEETLRDYYVVEDDGGRRFWIYRQGLFNRNLESRWFLHGFFS